ncbi:MAG: glycosyltransferase family 4 protein [Phocaeicola sp.]
MKRIKVLQVIRQGEIGGGESHLMDLVSRFDSKQVESVVLAFSDGAMIDFFKKQGIKCHVVASSKKFNLSIQKRVGDILLNEQIEIIHAHGTRAALNMVWIAKRRNLPLIYTVHGWSFHSDQNSLIHKLRVVCEKLLCSSSKQVICVSESNRMAGVKEGIKLKSTRCKVIENGINLDRFNSNFTVSKVRKELQIDKTDFIVGFVGRVTAQKSPIDFIKSIQLAHQQNPAIKGLFIGEGDLLPEVMAYVKSESLQECIYLSKFRRDIPEVLKAIDLFCLPSLWEGLSIALLEAMSMKKAVVVTPTDGTREIIVSNKNGVIVPFSRPDLLAEAYIELQKKPLLLHTISENARRLVEERFDAQRVSDKVTEIYINTSRK